MSGGRWNAALRQASDARSGGSLTNRRLVSALLGLSAWLAISTRSAFRLHRALPAPTVDQRTAVVVLGYPSRRSGRLHPVQKWRMQAAARTLSTLPNGWMIVSGGPTRGNEPEATVMARYAIELLGVDPLRIELEPLARSTWDNVRQSMPLARAGGADCVAFVSHPFHVERARNYFERQTPELAPCVVRSSGVRPLDQLWLMPFMHLHYLARLARDQRFQRNDASGA